MKKLIVKDYTDLEFAVMYKKRALKAEQQLKYSVTFLHSLHSDLSFKSDIISLNKIEAHLELLKGGVSDES